jgi:hypothetical protein
MVFNSTVCALSACDMGRPLQSGGIVHLGQEADRPYGDFDEFQAFTGIVDELRVWNVVRTDAQIRAAYQSGVEVVAAAPSAPPPLGSQPPASPPPATPTTAGEETAAALTTRREQLSFYWRFDEQALTRGTSTPDVSGNGRAGLVGAMPTAEDQLQYASGRPSQLPNTPTPLASDAPLVVSGSALVVPIVAGARASAATLPITLSWRH